MNQQECMAAVVSRDPFFVFTTKSLLGKCRFTRIHSVAESLSDLKLNLNKNSKFIHCLILDLDSLNLCPSFYDELKALTSGQIDAKILCIAEGLLNKTPSLLTGIPIRALLSKNDLGYCLHLAIRAVMASNYILITQRVKEILHDKELLYLDSKTIGKERPYPGLTKRVEEVILWRTLIGLDNSDIQDEMILGADTIREYISKGYKVLGADGELDAFDALSEWWWIARFEDIITT